MSDIVWWLGDILSRPGWEYDLGCGLNTETEKQHYERFFVYRDKCYRFGTFATPC